MPSASRASSATRLGGGLEEVLLEQQVLGRVAGQRQLGEEHQLGAGVARRGDLLGDLGEVALEVADAAGRSARARGAAGGSGRHGPHFHRPRPSRPRRTRGAPDRAGRRSRDAPPGERRGGPGAVPRGRGSPPGLRPPARRRTARRPARWTRSSAVPGSGASSRITTLPSSSACRIWSSVRWRRSRVTERPPVRAAGRPLVGHLRGRVVARAAVGLSSPGPAGARAPQGRRAR